MGFKSFNQAQEGDTTFLCDYSPLAYERLLSCKASKIYVYPSIYRQFDEDTDIGPRLVPVKNPKLSFMQELERTSPIIYHNNEEFVGALIIDGGLWGAEPLNVERDEDGKLYQFTYQGNIRVGSNVHIGNNVTVAKGALCDTVIEDNVMIDSNVFIGNETIVGSGSILCVGVIVGGGVRIGKDCFIGLGAVINNHVTIGDKVIVGSGAVVTNDVPDKDVVAGVPAKSIKDKVTLSREERYKMVGY